MRAFRLAFLGVVALFVGGGFVACAKNPPAESPTAPKSVAHFFAIKVGERTVRMQLAVHPIEQERGLMFRRDLAADDGMLFVYAQPQGMHYWMRNTPTPLDIGFFDEAGTLLEVYPMQPFDESTVSSRSDRVKFALEMNQRWFAESGVRPGAKLDLAGLAQAMKERGFDLAKFGLTAAK